LANFQLKIGIPFTRDLGNVYASFILIFYVLLFSRYESARTTDGRTDGQARRVMRPIGRPHNKYDDHHVDCLNGQNEILLVREMSNVK